MPLKTPAYALGVIDISDCRVIGGVNERSSPCFIIKIIIQ